MIHKFHEVGFTRSKNYRCACGKNVQKKKKFYQTLNPFNVDKSTGKPKGAIQIAQELSAEANAWRKVVEPCRHRIPAPIDLGESAP